MVPATFVVAARGHRIQVCVRSECDCERYRRGFARIEETNRKARLRRGVGRRGTGAEEDEEHRRVDFKGPEEKERGVCRPTRVQHARAQGRQAGRQALAQSQQSQPRRERRAAAKTMPVAPMMADEKPELVDSTQKHKRKRGEQASVVLRSELVRPLRHTKVASNCSTRAETERSNRIEKRSRGCLAKKQGLQERDNPTQPNPGTAGKCFESQGQRDGVPQFRGLLQSTRRVPNYRSAFWVHS